MEWIEISGLYVKGDGIIIAVDEMPRAADMVERWHSTASFPSGSLVNFRVNIIKIVLKLVRGAAAESGRKDRDTELQLILSNPDTWWRHIFRQ